MKMVEMDLGSTMRAISMMLCFHVSLFWVLSSGFSPAPSYQDPRCIAAPLHVFGGQNSNSQALSPIPKGISPFEKSLSKNLNLQAEFRQRAKRAIDSAISDNVKLMEVEFPPLLGGSQSKSQFDDFDNIQELDKNKDWTMLLAPMFLGDKEYQRGKTWYAPTIAMLPLIETLYQK